MKKINIYLAGKISHRDWRQQIVDIRNGVMYQGDYNVSKIKNLKLSYNNDIDIVGPFFLSCDHSCYHGENNHGLGINCPNGCYGENTFTEKQVNYICLSQIRRADVVFAYIDDTTCYGSLFELGYAKALNKPIFILYNLKNRDLLKDMWFINQSSYTYDVDANYENIKEAFDEMIKEFFKGKI